VTLNGLKALALLFVVPATNDGLNAPPGHAPPFGPEASSKLEESVTAGVPLHGVSRDVVV